MTTLKPSKREEYRGWHITYDPLPVPSRTHDWEFWHDDYDGPEDDRCGRAATIEAAKAEIDCRESQSAAALASAIKPIQWTKAEPNQLLCDGDTLLVAYRTEADGRWHWNYEIVDISCDSESPVELRTPYNDAADIEWDDVEYWLPLSEFHLPQEIQSAAAMVGDGAKFEPVTDEQVEHVEHIVGMGHNAWDMVDPKELIAACDTARRLEKVSAESIGKLAGDRIAMVARERDEAQARIAALEAACEKVLYDLNDNYDGCEDSVVLWMGEHIERLSNLLRKRRQA